MRASRVGSILVSIGILGSLALFLSTCATPQARHAPDPERVAAVSAGVLSRYSAVQVVFTRPRANREPGVVLQPSPITLSPPVAGTASWADERTLVYRPDRPLPAGRRFVASVNLSPEGPAAGPAETLPAPASTADRERFDFPFTVMRPGFRLTLEPLSCGKEESGPGSAPYVLDGRIVTTDRESPETVERVVQARLQGDSLPLAWEHDADQLTHRFRVREIRRTDRPGRMEVHWSGRPIRSGDSGRRLVEVPARGTFSLLEARVVQESETYIDAVFSEPLLEPQDLRGLVRLAGKTEVRHEIDGNRVRLYSLSPWSPSETLRVEPGILSADHIRLASGNDLELTIRHEFPEVRLPGAGAILPTTQGPTLPVETMNLRSVIVEAFKIYGDNIPQFLQVNNLDGNQELYRVGKVVWREVVPVGFTEEQRNTWVRRGIDLSPLLKNHPDGMFQLRVSFRQPHIVWPGAPQGSDVEFDKLALVQDRPRGGDDSYWDYYDTVNMSWQERQANKDNPLHDAYYLPGYYEAKGHQVLARRNVLVSNIGLMAKGEFGGQFHVIASDLRTALPLSGVRVTLLTLQRQSIASGLTDREGMILFRGVEQPAFVAAERMGQFGYLKIDEKTALITSHFDAGGVESRNRVKGFLYGERGVWRPGDPIYLTFILYDPQKSLPAEHPVTLELKNPRGQVAIRRTATGSLNGFYAFTLQTAPDDPTGDWEARVMVGDRSFTRLLKVEAVMPNRLKIGFDVPEVPGGIRRGTPLQGTLTAAWLHGAPAADLKADVRVRFTQAPTAFPRYSEYMFDDPARPFTAETVDLFEKTLDASGRAPFSEPIEVEGVAPGKLKATFAVRVFEGSGAFSTEQFDREFSPYSRYVGIQVPKGDEARGMLLTDTEHAVRIALLDPAGNPVSGKVQAEIAKIKWRWWWEKGGEDLSTYTEDRSYTVLQSDTVTVKDGAAVWKLQVRYPEWGRYLIRVRDAAGEHSTGKIVYIDWPGWAGRARGEGAGAAAMLTLTTDKPKYQPGETVTLSLPSNAQGRALVCLEAGGRVLKREWITPAEGTTRYQFQATPEMAPNIYAHVTFLQPHQQTANDLPIRLYGVVPVPVEDAATHLRPLVETPAAFAPDSPAEVAVREGAGREMTYTLAVVDEGLLRINRYSAPDPWTTFYAREASSLKGWDLYDLVIGAYAGKLENLLAVGGGDEGLGGERKANRFKPVVQFIGPVKLAKGGKNTHTIRMPRYVGAVRVMVVAGGGGAFGAVEKEVPVKSDLMVVGTLPRVLSVGEEIDYPVTVFNYSETLREASLRLEASGPVALSGPASQSVRFGRPEERLVRFRLKAAETTGVARLRVIAEGGGVRAEEAIEVDVRLPSIPETRVQQESVGGRRTWQEEIRLPGLPGTNSLVLEVSRIPPLDLGRNLAYLIQYPHGCVEQTTSSVFPQVYLDKLVRLSPEKLLAVQKNVEKGIERLRFFQVPSGGFGYWPGHLEANEWASSYAGHFLVEAGKRGYSLPANMLPRWIEYQQRQANTWKPDGDREGMRQAYRLYTLALAGAPELGAMNRLREEADLSATARWRLAAAYQLAGQGEEAWRLASALETKVRRYRELSGTFGSDLRDRAMILEAMVQLKMMGRAEPLAKEISKELSSAEVYGTQTTAYALLALARYGLGVTGEEGAIKLTWSWAGGPENRVTADTPVLMEEIPVGEATRGRLVITNESGGTIYPRITTRGTPPLGAERDVSEGLQLSVAYSQPQKYGKVPVDPDRLSLGSDLEVSITVRNTSSSLDYEQLALTWLAPGGWEIFNPRLAETGGGREIGGDYDYQDIRDDRVYTYFTLSRKGSKEFTFRVNKAYAGRFFQPTISVEAMYDPAIRARAAGKWLASAF